MKKIAIDCRLIEGTGISIFLNEILSNIVLVTDKEFVLFGDEKKLIRYKKENIKICHTLCPAFSVKEIFAFPVNEVNKCDAFYSPNFNIPFRIKVPIYSTIHDVVFLDIPSMASPINILIRKLAIVRAVKISKHIFTVSEFSKRRLHHHFNCSHKTSVVYNGITNDIKSFIPSKENNQSTYYLYIGNYKPYKGLMTLIKAYDQAKKNGLKEELIIIGHNKGLRILDKELISYLDNRDDIKQLGYVDRSTLLNYLFYSKALIMPSEYEGFGIPPLEALYLGKPVIVSDIEVFKEIYKELPVYYFGSKDQNSLSNCLFNCNSTFNVDQIRDYINQKYNYRNTTISIMKKIEV